MNAIIIRALLLLSWIGTFAAAAGGVKLNKKAYPVEAAVAIFKDLHPTASQADLAGFASALKGLEGFEASPEVAAFDNVAFDDENKRRRAAATDCSKFKRKKCTKKKQCKYEQGACVAKSSCEKKPKKGKCKKDADCTWKNDEKSCVDAVPDCSDYAKKGQCNKATGCKWKKQACVKDPGSESDASTDGGDSFDSACADSTTWRKKNKDKQNCAWVGKKAAKRCKAKVKSEDGVKAKVACPMACGTCDPADDKIAALEAENAALAAELEEAVADKTEADDENAALKAELEEAVADKTEAQGNVTTLEAKNAALEAAKASGEGCPTPAPTSAPTVDPTAKPTLKAAVDE